jgi:hypothetical protein
MINAYEVGAVFKVIDQASPALRFITREMAVLRQVIKDTKLELRTLGASFKMASAALTGLNRAGNLTNLNTGLNRATAAADRLVVSLRSAASTSLTIGGGGGGRVPHGPGRTRVSGGGSHGMGGMIGMGLLGALGVGIDEEAKAEDIAARAFITGQVKIDSGMRYTDAFGKLRDLIQKNASLGGFAPHEVGEAVLGSERQFAGLSFDKRMSVLDTMLPFAMQEARLKESGLKESAESLVGISHMTGTYDTAKLPDLYRQFAYASQLTPKSLTEYGRALSYSMPSLVGGMGMDPNTIMFLTAMNQFAGIGSSKAGTWIQSFFGKLMPDVGANLGHSQKVHNEALTKMGLLDSSGNPSWMVKGANGKTDWLSSLTKLSPILGSGLAAMPETGRLQMLDQIFGKQGGREASLFGLPEFIAQFPALSEKLRMATGGEDVLKQLGEASPVQQARQAFTDLKIVLMDIAQVALPPLVEMLRSLDSMLKDAKGITNFIPKHTGSEAVIGGVLGGIAGIPFGVPWLGAMIGAGLGGAGGAVMDFSDSRKSAAPGNGNDRPITMEGTMIMNGDAFARFVGTTVSKGFNNAPTGSGLFDPTMGPTVNDAAHAIP